MVDHTHVHTVLLLHGRAAGASYDKDPRPHEAFLHELLQLLLESSLFSITVA